MNLNGTEWLAEIDWKNFEKDRKSFGAIFKLWQKNNCGRAVFLEMLQAEILFQRLPCILRELVFQKKVLQISSEICFFA